MKIAAFTVADQKNMPYAIMMGKSFHHFHPDIPLIVWEENEIAKTGIKPEIFWYLATPYIAKELMKEYDAVLKIDADSIITGDLNHVFEDQLYDVATVLNWNRVDPRIYGEVGLITISPQEYFNNGFVYIRSRDFVNRWMNLCFGRHFERMPMREQGFLNILAYYGGFQVRCLDYSNMWHGLISKGEWNKCVMRDGKLTLPKAPDHYPDEDKTIKVIHWAGGNTGVKMNYKIYFTDECSAYLDTLVK